MMWRIFLAEGIKSKGICWWLPVIQAIILTMMTALEWYLYFRQGPEGVYAGFAVMYMFLSFVMMLGTTLLASIVSSVEHDTRTWKQLLAMPVPRGLIYLSKAFWIILLQALTALLIIAGMTTIWLLYTSEPIPWDVMLKQPLYAFVALLPALAIQLWLSTRLANQALPLAVGIFGSIASLFLARTELSFLKALPWAYPALSSPMIPGHLVWVMTGLVDGALILAVSTAFFARREVL
ncbi:ABC transporter permease [Paenibacillus elgii]